MKQLAAFALALCLALPSPILAETLKATGTVEAYFSPNGGAESAIVRELAGASREVLIQAYTFTSKAIARGIVEAKKRGVKVEAILDKSNVTGRYSAINFLQNAGVPVLIDGVHGIAHAKTIIIDRDTVLTGSFNFTTAAENRNAEVLLILKDNRPLVERFIANYQLHKAHSE